MQTGARRALSRPQSHAFSADGAAPPQGHRQARTSTQSAVSSPGALAVGLSLSRTSSCGEGATMTVTQPPTPRTRAKHNRAPLDIHGSTGLKAVVTQQPSQFPRTEAPEGAQAERRTLSLVLPMHCQASIGPSHSSQGKFHHRQEGGAKLASAGHDIHSYRVPGAGVRGSPLRENWCPRARMT